MRAAVLTRYGDVDALELRDMPEPKPGRGSVKIRIAASSLNPIDWKIRNGTVKAWLPVQFPAILGFDGSGEVVELGADVSGFTVGDKVLGLVRHGQAEFATALVEELAQMPSGLSLVDAACLPLVGLTGAQLLEEAVAPKRGDIVLVTGALGSLGRCAVHAALKLGVRVIAGVRSSRVPEASALGVERVVALDDAAAVAGLPTLQGIADTVGGDTLTPLLSRLAPGGTLGSVVGEPPGAKERGIRVRAIHTHPDAKRLATLASDLARGDLVLPIAGRFPLAQVREAFRAAEAGHGKVLLTL
jgi:NADPH:quinone reductase-like Zn-dependent oxidoreductase